MSRCLSRLFLIAFFIILMTGCVSSTQLVVPTFTAVPPTLTPAPTLQPSDSERKLTVNGVERSYLLHIPPGLDNTHPVPLMVVFDGDGTTPENMILVTGFNDLADQFGFLAAYPRATGNWNVGDGCCGYAAQNNIDDVAFVRNVLSDLKSIAPINTKRIYGVGASGGGGAITYRLGCEMSDTFAAIAIVAGTWLFNPCQPQEPVSLIHVHGMEDLTIPYAGGGKFKSPPIEQVISDWAKLDGCADTSSVDKSNTLISHTVYSSCKAGTSVELYTLENGGHIWPSKYIWPASQTIWDFFAAHPKP